MDIPLMNPVLTEEMIDACSNALKTERYINGKSVADFEKKFAQYIGTKHAVAINNGTNALFFSLLSMGIKKGDYVLTIPATFIATANAITYCGAKPAFVDISLDTYTINPNYIEKAIKHNRKIKAIIPVHLYGYPCNMDEIIEIAKEYDLKIIEDSCQAHGAMYKNKKVGTLGNSSAFSFYTSKNLFVAGDGGMVTTDDENIAEKIRIYRDVGRSSENPYKHEVIGYTARLNTCNAAIGLVQLKYIEKWTDERRKTAKIYHMRLDGVGDIILPPIETDVLKPVHHLFVIRAKKRDDLQKYLMDNGIQTGIHYPIPVHLQPPYRKMGFKEGMFLNAEKWSKEVLSLPLYPGLDDSKIDYICNKIEDFFDK